MGLGQLLKNLFKKYDSYNNENFTYSQTTEYNAWEGMSSNSEYATDTESIPNTQSFANPAAKNLNTTTQFNSEEEIKFLTTEEIKQSINSIVKNAKEFVTIICAKLELSGENGDEYNYVQDLSEFSREHEVNLICGLEDTVSEQNLQLPESIHFKFVRNLHAKCYMNEDTILLPTMNLNKYPYKFEDGIDIGLEIQKKQNQKLYEEIKERIDIAKKEIFDKENPDSLMDAFLKKKNEFHNFNKEIHFLETPEIMKSIHTIIKSASKFITIVSPYLNMNYGYGEYIDELIDATEKRNAKTNLVFGKDLDPYDKPKLKKIEKLNAYQNKKLHAKCYINEQTALVTSMNFTGSSKNKYEIGIKVYKSQNPELYKKIEENVRLIIEKSEKKEIELEATFNDGMHIRYNNEKNDWYCKLLTALFDEDFPAYGKGNDIINGKISFTPSSIRSYLSSKIYCNILNQFMAQTIAKIYGMEPWNDGNVYLITRQECNYCASEEIISNTKTSRPFVEDIDFFHTPGFCIYTPSQYAKKRNEISSNYDLIYNSKDVKNLKEIIKENIPYHEQHYLSNFKYQCEEIDASNATSTAEYFAKYFIACYYNGCNGSYYTKSKFITTPEKVQEIKKLTIRELSEAYNGLFTCLDNKEFYRHSSADKNPSETSPAEHYEAVEKWFKKIEEAKEIEFEKIKEKHRQNRLQSGNTKPE